MKLDFNLLDVTDFNIKECEFAGDACIWVFPKLEGTSWNSKNEVLRSSIWRKSDGELVSAGFKKFFNWEQKPEIHPAPTTLHNKIVCVEKLDGSCLIVTKYKGVLITRTRRALTSNLLNGHELETVLKAKYPKAFDNLLLDSEKYSLLFEWVTPSNQIVIRVDEPEIYLTGVIAHDDYSYIPQAELDKLALELGVKRPKHKKYSDIEHMLTDTTALKGEEGICVYYGNEQHIRKVKSDWYITIHNFRNEMNLKNIVDLYLTNGMPSFHEFCAQVENQYTYEGLLQAKSLISQICDAKTKVDKIIEGMHNFIERQTVKTRKEMAGLIIGAYGLTSRADIVFTLYDKKPLETKQIKKLLFQSLIAGK